MQPFILCDITEVLCTQEPLLTFVDELLRSLLKGCLCVCPKWVWAWSPAAVTFQEYPEHNPVSYLIYEDNAEIHIILCILGIFCGFSWGEIFQLEMKLSMSKGNEESQRGQGGWGQIQWVAPLPRAGGGIGPAFRSFPTQDSLILWKQLVSAAVILHKKVLKQVFLKESKTKYKFWTDKLLKLMSALDNFWEENDFHKKHDVLPRFSITY